MHLDAEEQKDILETLAPEVERKSNVLEKGVDLNTVRLLAGRRDVSTTVRYDKHDEVWQKNTSRGIRTNHFETPSSCGAGD